MIKPIAFYLPQYHPIPENDLWWGEGFTEWTNVAKAQPFFKGHYQPRLPGNLGFYDLRVPEVRQKQAELAKKNGIYGFCYYHYWFGEGKMLLERPIKEVLLTKQPDFPFCFCWANETWEGRWHGIDDNKRVLIKQDYPSKEDVINHFNYLVDFFKDDRYIKIGNKPIFQIYRPQDVPENIEFYKLFNELAVQNGFNGIYFIGGQKTPLNYSDNLDSKISSSFSIAINQAKSFIYQTKDTLNSNKVIFKLFKGNLFKGLNNITLESYDYLKFISIMHEIHILDSKSELPTYPILINDFDNTPRAGKMGIVLKNTSPENFKIHVDQTFKLMRKEIEDNFVFIKSWNEWAEGNYLESDVIYGDGYLQVLSKKNKEFQ
jgi:hypothetical protein